MASLLPDTDSEDEMPQGWEERISLSNRVFYVNHQTKNTQWCHPITGKQMIVDSTLPEGWQQKTLDNGDVVFFNKMTQQTTCTDPRLGFAREVRGDHLPSSTKELGASSTTEDVLGTIDLNGKVAIVTGANCGIGFETSKALALHGAKVILACRDQEKANNAIQLIKTVEPEAKLDFIHCDLTSLKSVKHFCDTFHSMNLNLHILILNAGVNALPFIKTGDGFETTFQVNYLSHFYLVQLLEKRLIESSPSRVVIVASESHRFSTINRNNILEDWSESNFISFMAYNDSKLCNVLFAAELARRLYKYNITVASCHPGNLVYTNMQRYWWFMRLLYLLAKPFTKDANQGAASVVYCAVSPEIDGQCGLYVNNCKECTPSASAQDQQLAKMLWNKSVELINSLNDLFTSNVNF